MARSRCDAGQVGSQNVAQTRKVKQRVAPLFGQKVGGLSARYPLVSTGNPQRTFKRRMKNERPKLKNANFPRPLLHSPPLTSRSPLLAFHSELPSRLKRLGCLTPSAGLAPSDAAATSGLPLAAPASAGQVQHPAHSLGLAERAEGATRDWLSPPNRSHFPMNRRSLLPRRGL